MPRWFSRVRWMILLPVAVFLGLGAWAFASPIGASPDDDFHLASIWCAGGDRPGLCAPGDKPGERRLDSSLIKAACYATDFTMTAQCQSSLFHADTPTVSTFRGSFSSNYPPIYYSVMNWFASPNIVVSAIVMRFVNILFFIGSAMALWFLLPREFRRTQLVMWAVTLVPLGLFIIASNNPSAWAITGVPTAWFALFGFLQKPSDDVEWSPRRIGLGVLFALEAFLASGARGDAAIYTILGSLVAIALTWRRSRSYAYALILPAVLAVGSVLFFLLSGQASVATQGLATSLTDANLLQEPRSALGVLAANIAQLPFLWAGAFGTWGLGWLDTPMPAIVWTSAVGVVVAVLFFVLGKSTRLRIWTAAAVGGLCAAIPLYILQRSLSFVGEQVQPRYILPMMIVFAGVLLLAFERADVSLTRVQGLLVALALSGASSMALFVNLKRYVSGISKGSGIDLNAGMQWWWDMPVMPMTVWVVGSLALASAFLGVFHFAHARR